MPRVGQKIEKPRPKTSRDVLIAREGRGCCDEWTAGLACNCLEEVRAREIAERLASRSDEDKLYDALLAVLYKARRIKLGDSLERPEGRKNIPHLLAIAKEFVCDWREVVVMGKSGIAPPDKNLDSDIPF